MIGPMNSLLIYPLFAMFLLTLFVMIRMFVTRVKALKSGAVKMSYFKIYNQEAGPTEMEQASRHFSNLFEAPVLFYVVTILGILFSEGYLFTGLAWGYVMARAVHAYIHLGSNHVMSRMRAYAVGWLMLILMWGVLMFHQLVPAHAS